MILKVTDSEEDFGLNVYKISLFNFGQREYHPFISSQEWDLVEIDLNDDTPKGYIKQLIQSTRIIPIFDKRNVSVKVLQLLCEIIPDDAALLKQEYMKDKDTFYELIDKLSDMYDWKV